VAVKVRRVPLLAAIGPLVMALAAGCAFYAAKVSPAAQPRSDLGYFYGRFHIDVPRPPALGTDRHETMGFVMRCDDGNAYTIRFSLEKRVQVIAAHPARCALDEVIFTDKGGVVRGSNHLTGNPPGGFVLAAGTAYYLGDYFSESPFKSRWTAMHPLRPWNWDLTSVDDNYEGTSAEMKRTFANLAGLPTQNRMLLPRKHVPGDARKHTGGPRSGPDDIVSTERAARLAGYTKRRYATPADCEAACPENGDCFPFRGDEGPAMTCVVRCKTDKDCPEGLACNCPDGDGSACRAVASTPDDRMAGICLSVEPAGERR
jgi:hypothetical protein